jgi:hypothetical protein
MVPQWMGHESLETTNRYVHFLGTDADKAGRAKLNARPGGTRGAQERKKRKMTTTKPRLKLCVCAGQAGFSVCGAEGVWVQDIGPT